MTIDEAIEILETFHDQAACTLDAASANAFKLGIEALKSIMLLRSFTPGFPHALLLGETEE